MQKQKNRHRNVGAEERKRRKEMEEISRMRIEEYCRSHKTKKAEQLARLVEMSYNLYCEGTDDDAIILENLIEREKDPELRKAIEDLDGFIFPY